MAEYNNVREFVINALKQYHARHASAEGEAIQTLLSDYATYTQSNTYYVAQEAGKGLSTNDFTTAYMTKLDDIEARAQVNVKANWNESDSSSDAYIQNKPDLTGFPTYAYWDSTNHNIVFQTASNGTVLNDMTINGADFIIDGMIDSVSIEDYTGEDITNYGASYLYIDFNTDAEGTNHTDIKIPLQDIFAPNNYYTKSEVDTALNAYETNRIVPLETAYTYLSNAYAYTLGYINDVATEIYGYGYITNAGLEASAAYTYLMTGYSYLTNAYSYVLGELLADEATWAASLTDINTRINAINTYGYITNAGLEASAAYTYLMNGYSYLVNAYAYTLGYIEDAFNTFDLSDYEEVDNKKTSLTVAANVSDTYYPSTSAVASYVGSLAELSQSELNDIFGISNQGGE